MNIHIKSIVSAFVFSLLFYSKSFGLNLVLISILVVTLVATGTKENKISLLYSFTFIATAIFVFLNPTAFTIFAYFMAFLVFVGKSISRKTSLYIAWILGIINLIIASAANYTGNTEEKRKKKKLYTKIKNRIKGGLIASFLLLVFSFLYKNANPVFGGLLEQINLDFVSVPWLFFTLLGYVLFFHILKPFEAKDLIEFDLSQSNELTKPTEIKLIGVKKKLESEHTLGSMVFLSLNALLVFFLVTDVIYLFQETDSSNSAYSESVHQGVYALMFSIVCAIVLILYFFRGNLNFFDGNKRIKQLTYVWITLNVTLVVFTAYKNYAYVEALGLTYKRIGVFVYLLLTLTGLVTAYIKVSEIKNFTYLARTNITALFTFLVLSAAVPWNKAITWFNLEKIDNPDIGYLIDLGANNSLLLLNHAQKNGQKITQDIKRSIEKKHSDFTKEQEAKTWQEYNAYHLLKKNSK